METEQPGKDKEEQAQIREEQRRSYLHDIGEAISSFLEPFGVKVDLDVLGDSQQQPAQKPQTQRDGEEKGEGIPSTPSLVPSGANVNTVSHSKESM